MALTVKHLLSNFATLASGIISRKENGDVYRNAQVKVLSLLVNVQYTNNDYFKIFFDELAVIFGRYTSIPTMQGNNEGEYKQYSGEYLI